MKRWVGWAALLLGANTIYLAVTAAPTVFYMANVLAHILIGTALAAGVGWLVWRSGEFREQLSKAALGLLGTSVVCGLYLAIFGNVRGNAWALWGHIGFGVSGVFWLTVRLRKRFRAAPVLAGLAVAGVMGWGVLNGGGELEAEVRNPEWPPASMDQEGDGPDGPFWPSSVKTSTGGPIPSDFFLSSEKCGQCHEEIFDQWKSSAHHFASFNNQFYRKSIEHMQEVTGSTQSSKWCAGCHDHAVLFSGKWEQPIAGQMDTPEAQAGLGCISCHSIVHVEGTMGNGGFTIEYPEIHELAASENPVIERLVDYLTYMEPEPHRRTFLKPFMSSSEFCSACHKVHLDQPVNNYRWLRGFNSYDNWQASGVSGQGARSFYYPAEPLGCADCHMPLVPAKDPSARNGMVHSHRFPGANTALAHVNQDTKQMEITQEFLKSGFIKVDIFAASPVEDEGLQMVRRSGEGIEAMTTFAVGEEAQQPQQITIREVGNVTAPLGKSGPVFQPGDALRVDVVVRTLRIGHFFPSGTVDSFDVWIELTGEDGAGRPVFRSGHLQEDGAVDPGAHFYRSFMLDGAGNEINKRNAWQARSVLYARLIPPGAADVVRYRLRIPEDAQGPITLKARLLHRKFTHYYTQYSYAGKPLNEDANVHHDSREWSFSADNIPGNVAGKIKDRIPDLPITSLAEDEVHLEFGPPGKQREWRQVVEAGDWVRWNDWGIGMLLQGDLKGAEFAFRKAAKADPSRADGWLNVARALIQEGEIEQAKPFLAKAKELGPDFARVDFFQAMAHKAEGDYESALVSLEHVRRSYPRDRVALNQIGVVRFRLRDYEGAVKALREVLAIDPEDLQAHYTLMLAYRGLGDRDAAARSQELFMRFKADESSQRLTARMRRLSPEANNERQPIHEHVSAE